jgi:hypothetical protein
VSRGAYFRKLFRGSEPAFKDCATRFAIWIAPLSLKCVPSEGVANTDDRFGTVL